MKLNDVVDGAYCINLDKREDRWQSCEKEFTKNEIEVERFSAIDGQLIDDCPRITRGEAGCLKSHLSIIKSSVEKDMSSICIFEDDVFFTENFQDNFSNFYQQVPDDWQFLYLAVNKASAHFSYVSENVRRVTNAYSAHAMLLRRGAMEAILAACEPGEKPIDVYYGEIQNYLPAYVLAPSLAGQKAGHSDIINDYVDYNWVYDLESR
jgi:GR25 family glycosyltransferase involved in LPS biosynthesis